MVRTEPEIKHSQFHANSGQIRIDQQHTFERTDRGLEIAYLDGELCEFEGFFKISRILEQYLKRFFVLLLKGFISRARALAPSDGRSHCNYAHHQNSEPQ